jgi:hypothetical protein
MKKPFFAVLLAAYVVLPFAAQEVTDTSVQSNDKAMAPDIFTELNELYDQLLFVFEYEDSSVWEMENQIIADGLLALFRSEESLSVDVTSMLPFIKCETSKDGLVKVYTWDTRYDAGTTGGHDYDSIVQYIPINGTPSAILVGNFYCRNIFLLNKNIYLLIASNDRRRGVHCDVLAFKIFDGALIPYNVFNENNRFVFSYHDAVDPIDSEWYNGSRVIVGYTYNFETEPFAITITYTDIIEYKHQNKNSDIMVNDINCHELQFIYNGDEFEGDYDLLKQLSPG